MNTSTALTRVRQRGLVPLLGLLVLGIAQADPGDANRILGRWHGTSICTKADWNAACNDETVMYEFVPSAVAAGKITLHAYKYVQQAPQPMYDLDFDYDAARGQWWADFANTRVSIRWSYWLRDDGTLAGKVVDLKAQERVARNVSVSRTGLKP